MKPSNVLLCDEDRVLLADFGIARLVGSAQHHTKTGGTIGSPAYLSPEQVAGEEVGPEADVFSLGLVLLECLTGVRAYSGSAIEVALARLHRAPDIPDDVEPAWRSLITRTTRREPSERPTATEVAALLLAPTWGEDAGDRTGELELTQDFPAVAPPEAVTGSDSSAPAARRRPRRRVWAGALVGLVLAGVVAVVLVAPWRGGGSTDSGDPVPAGVPSRLQQPLSQLHDAVEGHAR